MINANTHNINNNNDEKKFVINISDHNNSNHAQKQNEKALLGKKTKHLISRVQKEYGCVLVIENLTKILNIFHEWNIILFKTELRNLHCMWNRS